MVKTILDKLKFPVLLAVALFWFTGSTTKESSESNSITEDITVGFPVCNPRFEYDLALDTFFVHEPVIRQGETFSEIIEELDLNVNTHTEVLKNTANIFNIKGFRFGKKLTILSDEKTLAKKWLIYETNPTQYIKANLENGKVELVTKEIIDKEVVAEGFVKSTLWETMSAQGIDYSLLSKMEEALKCAVDFHHTRKGDYFKLIFDQKFCENKPVGSNHLKGIYFKQGEKEFYSLWFQNDDVKGFFDLEGRPMKKGFLKAPVPFINITSKFSSARLHPILNYVRPHFGTDYAAPRGTPILAVADGVVTNAEYNGGNGNFVKLKHDNTYETQYLHMQKFAKGIKRGIRVQQGQVIGYVGSTGLATGPHVCFRFWKNGKQVNHLKENLPRPQPMDKNDLQQFELVKDSILTKLSIK